MSRCKNVVTGETYMTEQNALRHVLKKCKKVKTYEQYCEIPKLLDANDLWDIWLNKCDNCDCDDFGYCLANDEPDGYAELNYCLPALVKKLENKLQRSDNNE